VPKLNQEEFRKILYSHPKINKPHFSIKDTLDELYPQVEKEVFAYGSPYTQITFPPEAGVTAYFSRNMTKDDLDIVRDFLKHVKVDILNTRAFKTSDSHFVITVGSVLSDSS
jgi:hypothetical protein